jgi:hypothetical protein
MASALLHPSLSELVSVADDDLEIAADPTSNRRTHERLKATELPWLKLARLKYGSTLRVLDISVGGILFETDQRLNPDSEVVIELAGEDTVILAPSRVLRSAWRRSVRSLPIRARAHSSARCRWRHQARRRFRTRVPLRRGRK